MSDEVIAPRPFRAGPALVVALAVVAIAGVAWAKWLPYSGKVHTLFSTRTWTGGVLFDHAGAAPSSAGAWAYWQAYFAAVWRAALVAIAIAVLFELAVPVDWVRRRLGSGDGVRQSVVAGLAAMPTMMCTCCTAPLAVALRRRGASYAAVAAFWLGNPVLNPVVLVFLALVLPWQFVAVRAAIGVVLVVGGGLLADRIGGPDSSGAVAVGEPETRPVRARLGVVLARYAAVLIPEYVLVVLLTGWATPWLADFGGIDRTVAPLALLAVAIVGALLVIPTGGEVPVILGLLAAGVGRDITGVLLIALPALSLPSLVMVGRTLPARVGLALAGLVVVAGLGSGLAVAALS